MDATTTDKPRLAAVLDVEGMIPPLAVEVLHVAGYRTKPVSKPEEALLEAFRAPLDLLLLSHLPPAVDLPALVKVIRRAQDCVSRRSLIFAVVGAATEEVVGAMRNSGIHQMAVGPLAPERLQRMLQLAAGDKRRFIEAEGYVGPDRRVRRMTSFGFTLKRRADFYASPARC